MATVSKAIKTTLSDSIMQGDIFKDVKYSYIDSEDESTVNIIEYEFPLSIVVSQSCDVIAMDSIISSRSGKPTKFMPSILLCPIYDFDTAKKADHLEEAFHTLSIDFQKEGIFNSDEKKVISKDWHYRFHNLTVNLNDNDIISHSVIDFKHYFTVPMSYLIQNKGNRLCRIDDIYAEQITLKFATFLSRVAMPD